MTSGIPLFQFSQQPEVPAQGTPELSTPAGVLRLGVRIQGRDPGPPSEPVLVGGGTLWRWDSAYALAECLRVTPHPELPEGLSIRGAEAAVWRVRARESGVRVELECAWDSGAPVGTGVPESGQGLESLAWTASGLNFSLGTPDAEALYHYRALGSIPDRLAELWSPDPATQPLVDYEGRGLRVRFPPLLPGEQVQSHFVVAWSDAAVEDDATWFAVDCTPQQLLPATLVAG